MKAIETEYKGYKFRSRLEARWAVFFDAIGIKWEYEPEGYQFEDGTMYLPDFYLPESKQYFEVKGVMSDKDMHKIEQLIKSGKDVVIGYNDFTFQACHDMGIDDTSDDWNEWKILPYELDDKEQSELCKCPRCGKMFFLGTSATWDCRCCDTYLGCDREILMEGSGEYGKDKKAELALNAAKQARFEHGEQPFVNSEIIKLESIEDKLEKLYDICDTSTESGRIDFLKKASNIIAEEKSRLSREVYIQSVCKKVNMPYTVLTTEVDVIVKRNRYANKYNTWHNISSEDKNIRITKRAEETIIYYLLKRPQEWEDVEKAAPPDCFVTPFHKRVYSALLEKMRESDKFTLLMLNGEFNQEEMGRISGIAAKNSELPMTFEGVSDCARVLKEFKPTPSNKLSNDELMNLFRSKNPR